MTVKQHPHTPTLYKRDLDYIPRIAAVHDLCGYGKCSLGIAIPVLSAAGADVCPVPTGLFSSHTAFPGWYMHDTTEILPDYLAAWKGINVEIDAVYSGFLGAPEQVDIIRDIYATYPQALRVVDPVMADHGQVYPTYTPELCQAMAEKFKDANIETVVGPVTGGILLAHETGKALGTRAIFTERVDGKMTFRRGFSLHEGERCLIVEDIVTTGGSIKEVIEVVKAHGGIPVAVSMLVDRSGGKADFGDVPCTALLHMDVETYKPDEGPLCKQGLPMTKRGSTGKK